MSLYEPLFAALERERIRYVLVGGLATVLHGHARLTADVDLVLDLDPEETRRALEVLREVGFEPRLPVVAADFADPSIRQQWVEERGMAVFSLVDLDNPMRAVDLFAQHPIPFGRLWDRSEVVALATTRVRIASIDDLIELKRLAGRPKDLDDIEKLSAIQRARKAVDTDGT